MIDTIIGAIGLLVTIGLAVAGILASRRAELRRDQVSDWAGRCIENLQTLALLIKPEALTSPRSTIETRVQDVGIQLSVLTEQGRLFFKNQRANGYGASKQPAYRGIRPLILDELIIAHQLAMAWPGLKKDDQRFAFETAVEALKRFVSLVQHEVGRERTASIYTDARGDGITFEILLSNYKSGAKSNRTKIPSGLDDNNWLGKVKRLLT